MHLVTTSLDLTDTTHALLNIISPRQIQQPISSASGAPRLIG
jgi:hypothetical protein